MLQSETSLSFWACNLLLQYLVPCGYYCLLSTYTNSLMVIVPGHIDHPFLRCLTEQLTFFIALRVLPQVFDDEGYGGVPAFQQVVSRPAIQRARFMGSLKTRRSVSPLRTISIYRLPSDVRMVGSNPSCSSFIQRNPSIAEVNCRPSLLMSNADDAVSDLVPYLLVPPYRLQSLYPHKEMQ